MMRDYMQERLVYIALNWNMAAAVLQSLPASYGSILWVLCCLHCIVPCLGSAHLIPCLAWV